MKIKNETKVGILALFAIVILVLGYNFLKGNQLFSKTTKFYAVFNHLGNLDKSNEVTINGLAVGTVYEFKPTDDRVTAIVVEIHLTRDVQIPANSVATISGSLVGASSIVIAKGNATSYLQSGDTISTNFSTDMMSEIRDQLSPTVARVNETIDSLKLVIGSVNKVLSPATNENLQVMISQLSMTSAHLQRLLHPQGGIIPQTFTNFNAVAANLARNNDQITQSLRNFQILSSNLANARIQQVVAALETTVDSLSAAAGHVNSTVSNFNRKLNSTDGNLGLMLNDRALYDRLNKVALSLEILADDIRVHPKRYVNVSVFGGKGTPEPLTSPVAKDTLAAER